MATSSVRYTRFASILIGVVIVLWTSGGHAMAKKEVRIRMLTLADRVQQLTMLSKKKPIVRMNVQKFNDLVQGAPRNYSVIAMFTALSPQRACSICEAANDEFTIVTNSFRLNKQVYSNKIFFVLVDFDECGDIFRAMKLFNAPVFIHFPANGETLIQDKLDIQKLGAQAELIARWIEERTDVQIEIHRPVSYSGVLGFVLIMILVFALLFLKRNNVEFLYSKSSWGVMLMFFIFCMTSGQMWNLIRNPPVMQETHTGISYILRSSDGQLVMETHIVFLLNATITLGMIFLIEFGKGTGDIKKRRVILVIGLAMFIFFFGVLLSIVKLKYESYPYSYAMFNFEL